jgi:hypothetical protein
MSYAEERAIQQRRDFTIDPQTGEQVGLQLTPETTPLVQICDLHGGYVLALLSLAQDPEGHNMALRCKVRTILSQDQTGLGAQIATCLVAEFGLTPEEAEALIPPDLVTPEMEEARRVRDEDIARAREQRDAGQIRQDDAEAQRRYEEERRQEHERPRDEHGRFISEEPQHEPQREA